MEYSHDRITLRTALKAVAVFIVGVFLLSYAIFQARFLIVGPQIVLTTQPELQQNDRRIFLEGTAYNISRLWLNDRQIFTDAQGNFKEALILENGYTISTLRAEDRYGRSTSIANHFVYAPASFLQTEM